jgi:hypothetical protein
VAHPAVVWHSGDVVSAVVILAGDAQSSDDIPGVVLVGAILGVLLLWAAIRAISGRKK